jgi:hypothetical protein
MLAGLIFRLANLAMLAGYSVYPDDARLCSLDRLAMFSGYALSLFSWLSWLITLAG